MNDILFSIIIPTYNREKLITNAINSVLNQNSGMYEIIVIDDGSEDNTKSVVQNISDHRILYYRIENSERAAARNYGVSQSKGKYITFLDSDDILYPNHLEEALNMIERKKHPEIFHLGYEIIKKNGKVLLKQLCSDTTLNNTLIHYGNKLSCIGVFIRNDIAKKYPFIEDRRLSGTEDIELWMRLGSRFPIYTNNKITSAMIDHSERSVNENNPQKLITRVSLFLEYLFEDPVNVVHYSKYKEIISANSYSYIALHLAMINEKKLSLKFLLKTFLSNPKKIWSRRFLATIKCLVLHPNG